MSAGKDAELVPVGRNPRSGLGASVASIKQFTGGFFILVELDNQWYGFRTPPSLWQKLKASTFNILHWTI